MVAKSKQSDIHYNNEETRLALLEQSIRHIDATLLRFEHRFDQLDSRMDSNFKWLLGVMIAGFGSLLGIIAHAQHWI